MLYLKKYFTEGLIQFTILLSLIGVRVDVDTYLSNQLPPLREIILGPSSAYTQTQFHNLRNTLDGYGIHPKSVDLDQFFTTRRLLNQVRQLDRLSVPSTELNAWLVHRDQETVVSAASQSSPSITLDNGAGLEDLSSPDATPAMRGGGGAPESTYNPNAADSSLGAVAPERTQEQGNRDGNDDLTKEDIDLIDILWRQDIDLGAGREVFNYSNRQKDSEEEKPCLEESKEGSEAQESWRNGVNLQEAQPVDGETGESIPEQLPPTGSQTSLSFQECLRLLEATFPFGEESEFPTPVVTPEIGTSNEEAPSTSRALPQAEPPLDLEQQWQDIMAIMELQAMEVNSNSVNASSSSSPEAAASESTPMGTFGPSTRSTLINQDVSLHQASLPSCSQDFPPLFTPQLDAISSSPRPTMLRLSSSNSSNINSTFGATNLTGLFLPPLTNGTNNVTSTPVLPDPFSTLLEDSMLDEISLLDLAMEEGFSQAQTSQLEDELDSDSGLSLDSSHSPASPSSSETSCSSAASSSSTSATFSEEGAVGYSTDSEAATAETDEGAVGGYQPGYSKLCRMSYQEFHSLPQLDNISHNHTYNLPLSSPFSDHPELPFSTGKKTVRDKQSCKLQPPQDLLDKQSSRDERRARAMKIPFSNEKIINLPVEEFNELIAKHHLSEAQLALIRDIRRRGKNKMAAQNCRKRKLDTILNLEQGVHDLRRDKARLQKEQMECISSIRQMKQKMQSLSQVVFAQLRDEEGRPYPPSEYSLQYGADGSVVIMPRSIASAQPNRKPEKKQKDKKK
ncbi:Endoplasmic reticulum membrane sensor NFE2L1 [Merluccius polli]|uniref:Endoplasmic reticulum membrane sensor NFE2L1 n=1 Tax=Merluccius polli TaxID=89951 RepID=A0AA47N3Q8_MERPO|nr:Endoplasmic reticulum membrane sensor NFE2L1 [Merluccius polli]